MPDIIITPSTGKLEFVNNSAQNIRKHVFSMDDDGLSLDAPLAATSIKAPLNIINVNVDNSNTNYPFVLASGSAETGIKCNKTLYVDEINIPENYFTIAYDKAIFESYKDYDFFWDFTGIRTDVPELITEL